jgi:hypothetical protein
VQAQEKHVKTLKSKQRGYCDGMHNEPN